MIMYGLASLIFRLIGDQVMFLPEDLIAGL